MSNVIGKDLVHYALRDNSVAEEKLEQFLIVQNQKTGCAIYPHSTDFLHNIAFLSGIGRSNDDSETINFPSATVKRINSTFDIGWGNGGMPRDITGAGTVSITAGGTTLTGIGTHFTTLFQVGDLVQVHATSPDWRTISAINSDTNITVSVAWSQTYTNSEYYLHTTSWNNILHGFILLNPDTGAVEAGFDHRTDGSVLLQDSSIISGGFTKLCRVGSFSTNGSGQIIYFAATSIEGSVYYRHGDDSLGQNVDQIRLGVNTNKVLAVDDYDNINLVEIYKDQKYPKGHIRGFLPTYYNGQWIEFVGGGECRSDDDSTDIELTNDPYRISTSRRHDNSGSSVGSAGMATAPRNGTFTTSGVDVVGSGTNFESFYTNGSGWRLWNGLSGASSEFRTVASVTDATHMTLDSAFSSNVVAGTAHWIACDMANRTLHAFVVKSTINGNVRMGFDWDADAVFLLLTLQSFNAGYTKIRRIASFKTDASGNFINFTATETAGGGIVLTYFVSELLRHDTLDTNWHTQNLTIPTGVGIIPKISLNFATSNSGVQKDISVRRSIGDIEYVALRIEGGASQDQGDTTIIDYLEISNGSFDYKKDAIDGTENWFNIDLLNYTDYRTN